MKLVAYILVSCINSSRGPICYQENVCAVIHQITLNSLFLVLFYNRCVKICLHITNTPSYLNIFLLLVYYSPHINGTILVNYHLLLFICLFFPPLNIILLSGKIKILYIIQISF